MQAVMRKLRDRSTLLELPFDGKSLRGADRDRPLDLAASFSSAG